MVSGVVDVVLLRVEVVKAVMEVLVLVVLLFMGVVVALRIVIIVQRLDIHMFIVTLFIPSYLCRGGRFSVTGSTTFYSTSVRNTGNSVHLTRFEYDAWILSQQVTGSSAPTATLAQTSKGSSSCLLQHPTPG